MQRRSLLKGGAALLSTLLLDKSYAGSLIGLDFFDPPYEPMTKGPFEPTWDSLQAYKVPDWFRNAKFGMWAHWGPQCQAEAGDWYAREMYMEGNRKYDYHLKKYGHPSQFGFKDIIHTWKADKWDPEELVTLYKNAGAQYFMALANHHDNFDLYDSKYQKKWNSTKLGPKKDIVGGWANAAKKNGLHFGVSVHAAHTWSWMETARRSDKNGPYAGIPYDGAVTKSDGEGKWWEGLDPQELYAQNHALSENSLDNGMIHRQWNWSNGVTQPSKEYCEKFYNRTMDLINKYDPDLVYFDDTVLPLWPVSDAGLRIAAHLYNKSIKDNGALTAVVTGKILDEKQRKALLWDIERGQSNDIEPLPWQTDTCIGDWHYDREIYDRKDYKTAQTIIHTLIDVVSKNGNLMLNVPVRGDGSIDELERKVVEDIGLWMQANGESIYETRPWKIFGEGPAQESAAALSGPGFNEGKGKPFTYMDVRFVVHGNDLYATVMGWPLSDAIIIKSLGKGSAYHTSKISKVEFVATKESLKFEHTGEGLKVWFPKSQPVAPYANPLKIS